MHSLLAALCTAAQVVFHRSACVSSSLKSRCWWSFNSLWVCYLVQYTRSSRVRALVLHSPLPLWARQTFHSSRPEQCVGLLLDMSTSPCCPRETSRPTTKLDWDVPFICSYAHWSHCTMVASCLPEHMVYLRLPEVRTPVLTGVTSLPPAQFPVLVSPGQGLTQ